MSVDFDEVGCEDLDFDKASLTNVGIATFTLASVGLMLNVAAIVFLRRIVQLRKNPFGMLLIAIAVSAIGQLLVTIFWEAPINILQTCSFDNPLLVNLEFSLLLFSKCCSRFFIYIQLSIAVNRFMAIAIPIRYGSAWTIDNTIRSIAFIAVVSIVEIGVFVWSCRPVFVLTKKNWEYTNCDQFSSPLGYYHDVAFVVLILAIDLITLTQLRNWTKKTEAIVSVTIGKQKRRLEIRLFIQALITGVLMIVPLVNTAFVFMSTQLLGKEVKWIINVNMYSGIIVTTLQQLIDAAVILVFNPEIRNSLKRKNKTVSVAALL